MHYAVFVGLLILLAWMISSNFRSVSTKRLHSMYFKIFMNHL